MCHEIFFRNKSNYLMVLRKVDELNLNREAIGDDWNCEFKITLYTEKFPKELEAYINLLRKKYYADIKVTCCVV